MNPKTKKKNTVDISSLDDVLDGCGLAEPDSRYPGLSFIPFAFHLIPPRALAKVAVIMRDGEMAGRDNDGWKEVPPEEHINHAISHLIAYLGGRREEDHLSNAVCRIMFASELNAIGRIMFASELVALGRMVDSGEDGVEEPYP